MNGPEPRSPRISRKHHLFNGLISNNCRFYRDVSLSLSPCSRTYISPCRATLLDVLFHIPFQASSFPEQTFPPGPRRTTLRKRRNLPGVCPIGSHAPGSVPAPHGQGNLHAHPSPTPERFACCWNRPTSALIRRNRLPLCSKRAVPQAPHSFPLDYI